MTPFNKHVVFGFDINEFAGWHVYTIYLFLFLIFLK